MIKQWLKIICVCFLLGTVPAVAGSVHYAMVVDAGSTGSRLFLFSYKEAHPQALPTITEVYVASVQPGLSSYASQPEEAGSSLKSALDGAEQKLKALGQNSSQVTISVLGTGGMRLLPVATQEIIYKNVSQYLKQHYQFTVDQVKTITGRSEGLYGWLDVNYLMGSLQKNQPTYGNIDMGGATTQIAFEVADLRDPEDEVTLQINGRTRIIYSKSFIGLGLEESRKEMNGSETATSCYPHHYQENDVGYGKFNFNHCERAYDAVIKNHQVRQEIKGIPEQSFIAYSGAYYTLDFFGMRDRINQGVVESNLQSICSHSWEELQNMYPNISAKELSSYCAYGVYIDDLFYKGYQLHDSQVSTAERVNQKNINWALGALLYGLLK